jgi:hypothetical protein
MTDPINSIKLPIIATFIQVLYVMKERYLYFLKFSIPIVAFMALMFIFGESIAPQKSPGFMGFVLMVALMLVISIVVVAFHRTFIMDIEDVNNTAIIRLTTREWKFIGWYFAVFFFAGILMVILAFVFSGFLKEGSLPFGSIQLLGLPIYYLLARWLLVLPATSVDDEEASMTTSWHLSEGNGWRLVVLVFLLPLLMSMLNLFLFSQGMIVFTIIGVILYLLSLVIGVGVISLSYSYLKLNKHQSPNIEA